MATKAPSNGADLATRSRLQVLGAAVLFSSGGAAVKACELTAWQVASFRCGAAALFLLLLLPETRGRYNWRTFVVGCAYASTLVAYVLSNKLTTAANAIFLQSASPLYLLVLAPLLLGESIRRRDLVTMAVMVTALILCFGGGQQAQATAPDPATGNLWGLLAGFAWALTVLGLRWLASDDDAQPGEAVRAVVSGSVLAFVALMPLALPLETAAGTPPSLADWLWILYLGAVQIGLAYVLLSRGMAGVPAFEASLLLLAEPVLSPFWAYAMHDEVPNAGTVAGGVLILVATLARTWLDWRARRARMRMSEVGA